MLFLDCIHQPGEHSLMLEGVVGPLEAVLTNPETINTRFIALLGHPHSLQGGSMTNKVVTTMARVFKELGIPSLRFNFRGVGGSAGHYDHGLGESEDMLLLARQWLAAAPGAQLICAGFSFGSYVAYRTASQINHTSLITIAPPVHHYDYMEFKTPLADWLVIQGDKDEVVPFELVEEFVQHEAVKEITMLTFTDTSHFFHGKLLDLKSHLIEYLQARIGTQ